ncbi:MAG TPA: hypothetical protein VL443_21740 [Cyclobacteriaceae bacterium]|jgi:hypothetical protein|nr:hypothetical protein [Cyclobacteriaceae bacterium]
MIRNRILLKTFAAFFLIEMLSSSVAPAISWALTAGPTAPEATSFEPVDTTDMVNLNTGDLTYNLSLLEVPGPSGGYPLSLSYHAGTLPEEEATWTGLGFSLNPGSINRTVNGIADDYNGTKVTERLFWEGGKTTSTTVGVSFGIGNFATVGGGMTVANDTYRGYGVGGYVTGGVGYSEGSFNIGVHGTVGQSPYGGGVYGSAGISVGVGGSSDNASLTGNVGLDINSSGDVSAGFSVGMMSKNPNGASSINGSLLDASISSSGGKPNFSIGGGSSGVYSSSEAKIRTRSHNQAIDIPVYYGVNLHLGHSYMRYWKDETKDVESYGSLFFPESSVPLDLKAFDSYHTQNYESMLTGKDPATYMDGSFADYDMYAVNAQGLAGNFRPHHYTLSLYHQNTDKVKGYYIPQQSRGFHFRFLNEFTNRVLNDAPSVEINKVFTTEISVPDDNDNKREWTDESNSTYTVSKTVPLYFPFADAKTGIEGYEEAGKKRITPNVPGSKHIEYLLSKDISANGNNINWITSKRFIETTSFGFVRSVNDTQGQVGAFQITNASGVTYHFSLPAYAFNEYSHSQNKDKKDKISFNSFSQKGKYAYTWYLTAITGPDYVDRSSTGSADGKLDEFDFGYWVSFEYGKWAPSYQWRAPVEGYNDDYDNDFQSFSKGQKELYYLNAIRTKSHTALFVKEMRADAKGTTSLHDEAVRTQDKTVTWTDEGGVEIKSECFNAGYDDDSNPITICHYRYPTSSLKLTKIILLDNLKSSIDLSTICSSTTNYNNSNISSQDGDTQDWTLLHSGDNILDVFDLASQGAIQDNALRVIDFNYDYSLCPETINSFDEQASLYTYPFNNSLVNTKSGKLTLKSVAFKGKGGKDGLIPPIKFQYEIDDNILNSKILSVDNTEKEIRLPITISGTDDYVEGDIVVFEQSGKSWYGYVKNSSDSITIKIISAAMPSIGGITKLRRTKNPPYNKDLVDIWGNYKVDYENLLSRNADHYPSPISSKGVDVWSLHGIKTSTGSTIRINYESDTYSKSCYLQNLYTPVNKCSPYNGTPKDDSKDAMYIEVIDKLGSLEFDKRYKVGDIAPIVVEQKSKESNWSDSEATSSIYEEAEVQLSVPGRIVLRFYAIGGSGRLFIGDPVGALILPTSNQNYGGGLRVKSICIDNLNKPERSTNYSYEFNGISSGVTTYEPFTIASTSEFKDAEIPLWIKKGLTKSQTELLKVSRFIPPPGVYYSKIRITEGIKDINGVVQNTSGYSEYVFNPFDPSMVQVNSSFTALAPSVSGANSYDGNPIVQIQACRASVSIKTQQMGALKSISLFNNLGVKLSETINEYQWEYNNSSIIGSRYGFPRIRTIRDDEQGVITETFNHARIFDNGIWMQGPTTAYVLGGPTLFGLISQMVNYPSIQIGSTTTNFKTGIVTKDKTLEFDFYTGNPLKSLSYDGFGNYYLNETTPAYKVYPQMGLKVDATGVTNLANGHMLDQIASNYLYKVTSSVNLEQVRGLYDTSTPQYLYEGDLTRVGLTSASIQTWSNQIQILRPGQSLSPMEKQTGIWRKKASYSFIGDDSVPLPTDGLYPIANLLPVFASWDGTTDAGASWQKNGEITLYDVQSHALEVSDLNGNYAATKMTPDQIRVTASIANSEYGDFSYTGAEDEVQEDDMGNQFKLGTDATVVLGNPHTGVNSVKTDFEGVVYENDITPNKKYTFSFWASSPDAVQIKWMVNGQPTTLIPSSIRQAGNWYQYNVSIFPKSAHLKIWCQRTVEGPIGDVYFDDFRIFPTAASMVSYVYNRWGELSHILDNQNMYTKYEYDGMGRLIGTYKETFIKGEVKVSEQIYHYAGQD